MFTVIIYNIRTEIYPYYTTFNQLLLFIPVFFVRVASWLLLFILLLSILQSFFAAKPQQTRGMEPMVV